MPILEAPCTTDDLARTPWQEVISSASERTCEAYCDGFCRSANAAESKGEVGVYWTARALAYISMLRLHPDNIQNPFASINPDLPLAALGEYDIAFLRSEAGIINDDELLARINDVLWVRCKDRSSASLAVDNYLASAERLRAANQHFHAVSRYERALRLALSLRIEEKRGRIVERLVEVLDSKFEELNFLVAKYAECLQLSIVDIPANIARRLEELAVRARSESNHRLQRRLLEIAITFHRRSRADDPAREAQLAIAESFVDEAREVAKVPNIVEGQPAHLLECAIHALRQVGNTKARVDELLLELENHQKRFVYQMLPTTAELELNEIQSIARTHVDHADVHHAVMALAQIRRACSVESLRERVRAAKKDYLFQFLFSTTMVSSSGRTVARRPPITNDDDDESPAFIAQMMRDAVLTRDVAVLGLIEPARQQIFERHSVRANDLADLVFHNPLIPAGREIFFLQGLALGFAGDFMAACHILIPQIEHLIRQLLAGRGVRTTTFDSNGIQDEHGLDTTLKVDELKVILGEDLVFDMQGLLVDRFGSNLRNELAHGLRDYSAFFRPETVYCWWLTLHLLSLPIVCTKTGTTNGQAN